VEAVVHHYGWVKDPAAMQGKQSSFNRYWHDDAWIRTHVPAAAEYAYEGKEPLARFEGSHPAVMRPRIAAMNWRFSGDPAAVPLRAKDRLKLAVERLTGWRPGEYRNYVLV
jgi:hypothetical protein